ncbi:MAG: ribosome silencing factor [Armatimonadetes bacterium]|nr:ribosome silencing factor [Armatimonadota bacterium]
MDSEQKLKLIQDACEDKKAADLVVMDLRGKTVISDYFVICTGTSKIHCRAIADGLLETMKDHGIKGVRCEGYEQGTWILLDYADVVVHIFAQEEREYYDLEDLWTKLNTERAEEKPEEPVYAGASKR